MIIFAFPMTTLQDDISFSLAKNSDYIIITFKARKNEYIF
jgi:hypothetical protein